MISDEILNIMLVGHEITPEATLAIQEAEGTDYIFEEAWNDPRRIFKVKFHGKWIESKQRHCQFCQLTSGVIIVQVYVPDEQDIGTYKIMLAEVSA